MQFPGMYCGGQDVERCRVVAIRENRSKIGDGGWKEHNGGMGDSKTGECGEK